MILVSGSNQSWLIVNFLLIEKSLINRDRDNAYKQLKHKLKHSTYAKHSAFENTHTPKMRPILVFFLPAVIIFIFTVINAHALMAIKYVILLFSPREPLPFPTLPAHLSK